MQNFTRKGQRGDYFVQTIGNYKRGKSIDEPIKTPKGNVQKPYAKRINLYLKTGWQGMKEYIKQCKESEKNYVRTKKTTR